MGTRLKRREQAQVDGGVRVSVHGLRKRFAEKTEQAGDAEGKNQRQPQGFDRHVPDMFLIAQRVAARNLRDEQGGQRGEDTGRIEQKRERHL